MIEWSVLIHGVGVRVVVSEDIDGAYAVAMKEYGCKLEEILSVFCHTPFCACKPFVAAPPPAARSSMIPS